MVGWVNLTARECPPAEVHLLHEEVRRLHSVQRALDRDDAGEARWLDDDSSWGSDGYFSSDAISSEATSLDEVSIQIERGASERFAASWDDSVEESGDDRSEDDFSIRCEPSTSAPSPDLSSGRSTEDTVLSIERFLEDGQLCQLPSDLRRSILDVAGGAALPRGPSGRLMAVLAGLRHLGERMDETGIGRTALNFGHTTLRSLGSVGLTTLIRQAVGRAIDLALVSGTSELTRTLIGAGAMGLPVLGQVALLWRDEQQKDATPYSRATRAVLMGLALGACGAAVATGTLTNPGLRLAETIVYPLLRDAVQARFPMLSEPDSGPTRRSLAAAGTAYAVNQLGVSRAFAAAPDATASGLLAPGLLARSLANAAGESVDLMSLLYANHFSRHGTSTIPRLRIGQGDLGSSLRTRLHWDTMAARGCFVSAFNQMYDTMLADHTLTRALRSVVGEDHAFTAADWMTEMAAAALTALTYPFWTDPVHARGFNVPAAPSMERLRAMEEGRGGPDQSRESPSVSVTRAAATSAQTSPLSPGSPGSPGSPVSPVSPVSPEAASASPPTRSSAATAHRDAVQYAGNRREPAVVTEEVTLVSYRPARDRSVVTRL